MRRQTTMRAAFEAVKVTPGKLTPMQKQLIRVMERADKTATQQRRRSRKK